MAEISSKDIISPGSRPIQRKPKAQKRSDEFQSELSRSFADDEFVPPHIFSLPAHTYDGGDLCYRPVSFKCFLT